MGKQANRELAGDFVHTNAEFEKLKSGTPDDVTPRETPSGQGPGGSGYNKPLFDEWTTEELRHHAATLAIDGSETMPREALLDAIAARDATRQRGSQRS